MSANSDHTKNPLSAFRPDIQGLRAVAVVLVLIYHIWPEHLSGGYIGVDVFFVISGYLITGLLLREIERTGSISITRFYGRRIKRLLPAATVVLLAVGAASFLWLPITRLEDTGWEILASALYLENWLLAFWSVDYLAEGMAASPVQHYWTLSVEEQFYIVWPWLILLFIATATRWDLTIRTGLWILIITVGGLSLAHSISATASNQAMAFFMTTTRVWELALGASLALITLRIDPRKSVRDWFGVTGLSAIVLAAFIYSDQTAFPGYAALLPTIGAALIILAGTGNRTYSIHGLLSSTPFQYLGNTSYTLYLWHWPIIIFYGILVRESLTLTDGLAILGLSLLLTHLTYTYIESPIHHSKIGARSTRSPYALAGACTTLCIIMAVGIYMHAKHLEEQIPQTVDASTYPGARALVPGADYKQGQDITVIPNPLGAQDDHAIVYEDGCRTRQTDVDARGCDYGNTEGEFHIVLAGDSYAVHWLPALIEVAEKRGWRVTAFNKSACVFADVTLKRWERDYHECSEWNQRAMEKIIALEPDVVMTGHFAGHEVFEADSEETRINALVEGYQKHWSKLAASEIPVLAIRETPRMTFDAAECLATSSVPRAECVTGRAEALSLTSSFERATKDNSDAAMIDFTETLCVENECPAIIGNILVYRDGGHLTATFARTLAPAMESRIDQWIQGRQ